MPPEWRKFFKPPPFLDTLPTPRGLVFRTELQTPRHTLEISLSPLYLCVFRHPLNNYELF